MRTFPIPLILFAAVGSSAAQGQPASTAAAAAELRAVLHSMIVPPGQINRTLDPDQGDDHASIVAITRVCTKDTPAATRSAICPVPISPD